MQEGPLAQPLLPPDSPLGEERSVPLTLFPTSFMATLTLLSPRLPLLDPAGQTGMGAAKVKAG